MVARVCLFFSICFMLAAMSSSSKYLPNPKKRQRNDGDPEFPCLPGLSFASVASFAKQSQFALKSVDFSQKYLSLPLISPHLLSERFKVMDGSVNLIMRTTFSQLRKKVTMLEDEFRGMYVRYIRLLTWIVVQLGLERATYCTGWPLNIDWIESILESRI